MGIEPAHYNHSLHDVYGVRRDNVGFSRVLPGLWRRPQGRRRGRDRLPPAVARVTAHLLAHATVESDHDARIPE